MESLTLWSAACFALLGSIVASFAGVVSERLYTGTSFVTGRSQCDSCGHPLGALDLIPVLSWMLARGRCRRCLARVPFRHVMSEAALGLVFALAFVRFGLTPALAAYLAAFSALAFIVLYDLRHTIVPMGSACLLLVSSLLAALLSVPDMHAFGGVLLGAGLIGSGFFLAYALSHGRAMGLGDAPVALSLSLLAGPLMLSGLLFSFWIGALIGVGILVAAPKGHRIGIEVPFVPFLAAGFLLAIFTQWTPFLF